ncbi:MAG: glycosyltransferase [Proteobacteria bacterium]|nr:glycosyltransferase [Pseudomonadota bacterium]
MRLCPCAKGRRLKIAYLSLLPPPGQPASSGVPKVSETLLRAYEPLPDLQVDAVTLVDGLKHAQTEQRGAVTRHYLPCKPHGKTATLYWNEVRRLRAMVERLRPDVVHGQPSSEYLLAATAGRRAHVITLHGLVARETKGLARLHPETFAGIIRDRLHRRAAARATNIISISPYVDDWLAGWTQARLWPVPNPIDPEFFTLPPAERTGLRILCVGTVSARKNQALLVRACAQLATAEVPFECRLVGQPAPGVAEQLNHVIATDGLNDRVRLTGLVSRAELLDHYTWANVVVLPSREETAPLSLIQGMAAGRRVLGANAAGIPRLLAAGQWGGLFPGDDATALAAQLKSLGVPAWETARAAQIHARATFEPAAVARQTVTVYQEILRAATRRT